VTYVSRERDSARYALCRAAFSKRLRGKNGMRGAEIKREDPVRTAHRVSRPILTWNVCPSHKEAPASTHIKDFPGERAHPKYAVSEK
jgi:hypothetical protein